MLINIPDRGAIVAGDLDASKVTASWPTGAHRLNFPLALGPDSRWFALVYRLPAALQTRDGNGGAVLSTRRACGDADDLFVDGGQFLIVCGAGHVDIASIADPKADSVRVTTAPGARTGLWVPELKTLFVAVPARGALPAALWVLRAD